MGVELGPFELLRPAARGGMAQVWQATHMERDVPVAIKLITGDFAKDPAYHARFADEVRAVAALDHPGVVTVLDHGRVDGSAANASGGKLTAGTPWLAMEYCSQGTLAKVQMPQSWPKVRAVLLSTLDALAHAHARGVIHRDLKPPNLLRAGPRDLRPGLKLSDFGIAWVGGKDSGTPMGTPRYMAPEQIQSRWRDYGPWTDLYSLGCLAWWLVTGRTPFRAKRVSDTLIGHLHRSPPFFDAQIAVPQDYEAWCRVLLAKDPRRRYQRAADAAAALLRLGDPMSPEDLEWHEDSDSAGPTLASTVIALTGELDDALEADLGPLIPRPAPIPFDWRHKRVAPPPPALVGAGLSLFGLRAVPVVGREAERDLLWRQLQKVAQTGRPHAVLISGAAGAGKSRLAEWLCQRADEVGAAEIGRAVFAPQLAPGAALQRMGRDYFQVHDLAREDVATRVDERLAPLGATAEERQVLTEILCPATDADRAMGAPTVRLGSPRDYLAAIAATMRVLSADRPMIAWLDDVQWGVHGLGLALQILSSERPSPILLVLTLRSEAQPEEGPEARRIARLVDHENCEQLSLDPLSEAEHRSLVGAMLGGLDPQLAGHILERTAGNPLFALQLIGAWVQRGVLVAGERGLTLADNADITLPDDLHDVWQEQIDRLLGSFGPAARGYLEIAATLGQSVDRDEWRAACDDPEGHFGDRFPGDEPLRAALVERMLTLKLAVGTVKRWSFVHGMLRESLEREAREAGRLEGHHLSCAQMLGRAQVALGIPERLGRHLLAAGKPDEAVDPLIEATTFRQLTVGPEPALTMLALARQAVAQAGLPASDPRRGQLAVLRSQIASDAGDVQTASEAVERALDQARAHGWTTVELEATAARAALHLAEGDHTAATVDLEALRDAARGKADGLRLGNAAIGLAEVARARGEFTEARTALLSALGSLEAAADVPRVRASAARAWRLLGRVAEASGDLAEARERYQGARQRFDRLGDARGSADCLDRLGRLASEEADNVLADELLTASLSRYEALGDERRFTVRLRLGLVRARAGDPDGAWHAVSDVQQAGVHLDHQGNVALGHALRLVRAAVDADWAAWADAFAQTASNMPTRGLGPGLVAWLGHIAGVITADRGQIPLARQALGAAASIWTVAGQVGRAAEISTSLDRLGV